MTSTNADDLVFVDTNWDGLIMNAAKQAGARRIFSEDLQAGRTIEGILVVNPFV